MSLLTSSHNRKANNANKPEADEALPPAYQTTSKAEADLAGSLFGHVEQGSGGGWHDEDDHEEDDDELGDDGRDDDERDDPSATAWADSDDEDLLVSLTSQNRLKKLRNSQDEDVVTGRDLADRLKGHKKSKSETLKWAQVDSDKRVQASNFEQLSDDESDNDELSPGSSTAALLSSTVPLTATPAHILPPNNIVSIRRKDINQTDPSKSSCLTKFHPSGALALTAGMDKTLRFFAVDGEENKKIHGIQFPDLPIMSAAFVKGGESVILSGRRPFLYTYDVTAGVVEKLPKVLGRNEKSWEKFATSNDGTMVALVGQDGYVVLLTTKTFNWMGEVKMNGTCRTVAFSPCSQFVIASGSDGDVYKWDIRMLKGGAVSRFKNEDGTVTSALAVSSSFTAVGAESGVVNIYRKNDGWSGGFEKPRSPMKAVMNITTACDQLQFNHDGQILAMASKRDRDTLKLLHMPSATVFANWPTSKTPLGHVWSLDFSPKSGYLAIGNDKGKCMLYRLEHYNEI